MGGCKDYPGVVGGKNMRTTTGKRRLSLFFHE
jgi:hypothetical protein